MNCSHAKCMVQLLAQLLTPTGTGWPERATSIQSISAPILEPFHVAKLLYIRMQQELQTDGHRVSISQDGQRRQKSLTCRGIDGIVVHQAAMEYK